MAQYRGTRRGAGLCFFGFTLWASGWLALFGSPAVPMLAAEAVVPASPVPPEWRCQTARLEVTPQFGWDPRGGPDRQGGAIILHDARAVLDGWFERSFPVTGGATYRLRVARRTHAVGDPARSCLVRLVWHDDQAQQVAADQAEIQYRDVRPVGLAEPEHPRDQTVDSHNWTWVEGNYRAPRLATRAIVELHLSDAPRGRVEWGSLELAEIPAPPPRPVRLAAVHHRPNGKTVAENCAQWVPLIQEAAAQRADLVVLGETLNTVGIDRPLGELAEAIPGTTTDFFAAVARSQRLHLVFSMLEREGHAIYNTAVLIDDAGELIGKYRKVCLPHAELEQGIARGNQFPVFPTRFGKLGMMICYDGFFPEVARELTRNGAELIAWPVWGCDPLLAQARACENRVFVVSSTYSDVERNWMLTAIYDRAGQPIVQADRADQVVVAEVDLARPVVGPYNLGDFASMIPRHWPGATSRERGAEWSPASDDDAVASTANAGPFREHSGVKHVTVYHQPGRYGGWPANHGIWNWGDEILVGFGAGYYQDQGPERHAIDHDRPEHHLLARSLDGGESWSIEDPAASGALLPVGAALHGSQPPGQQERPWEDCPGDIDFTHPDFAMTLRMTNVHEGPSRFYWSSDRGHTWRGPYRLPLFGQQGVAARTDYLSEGPRQCLAFLTASKSDGREGRPFCARTLDGGKSWSFVSWIGDEPAGYGIMPTSVRLSDSELVTVVRRREGERHWLELFRSSDNGVTWPASGQVVADTGLGNPASLIRLRDGRLCLTYGVRAEPFRVCGTISADEGRTWGPEIVLRSQGGGRDIGYPRTVERRDGKLVTVYYFWDARLGPERFVAATIWDSRE